MRVSENLCRPKCAGLARVSLYYLARRPRFSRNALKRTNGLAFYEAIQQDQDFFSIQHIHSCVRICSFTRQKISLSVEGECL